MPTKALKICNRNVNKKNSCVAVFIPRNHELNLIPWFAGSSKRKPTLRIKTSSKIISIENYSGKLTKSAHVLLEDEQKIVWHIYSMWVSTHLLLQEKALNTPMILNHDNPRFLKEWQATTDLKARKQTISRFYSHTIVILFKDINNSMAYLHHLI